MVAPSKEDLNAPIPSRLPRTQVRTGQNGSVALAEALAHTRSFATYENRVGCISCDSSVDASACAGETEGGSDDGKVGAPVPCAVSPSGTDAMAAEPPATRSTTKGKGTPPATPRSPHAPRRHAPSQRLRSARVNTNNNCKCVLPATQLGQLSNRGEPAQFLKPVSDQTCRSKIKKSTLCSYQISSVPDLRDALFPPASFRGLPKLSSSRVSLARPRKLTEFCNFSATVRLLVWPNSLVFLKPRRKNLPTKLPNCHRGCRLAKKRRPFSLATETSFWLSIGGLCFALSRAPVTQKSGRATPLVC